MARNLKNLSGNNRAKQALQSNKTAKIVEPILPPPPPPPVEMPSRLVMLQGIVPDGTDYGGVKVEDGKLVVDMDDFPSDYGTF